MPKKNKMKVEIEYVLSHTAKTVKGELIGFLNFCDILPTLMIRIEKDDFLVSVESIVTVKVIDAPRHPVIPFKYPEQVDVQ